MKRSAVETTGRNLRQRVESRSGDGIGVYGNSVPSWSNDRPVPVWVSPSSLRNFANGDPLLDFLDMKTTVSTAVAVPNPPRASRFVEFIMNQGVEFENRVVTLLQQQLGSRMTVLALGGIDDWRESSQRTLTAMRAGAMVIYHGRLCDEDRMTRGEPDLLVRADFLNQLFPGTIDPKVTSIWAPGLRLPTHYVVVEIKYHTLTLRANGRNLLNNPSAMYYKLQTQLYTQMLGRLQGYEPKEAYILGRGYTYRSRGVTYASPSCMGKLGVVDFVGTDSDTAETLDAGIQWIRRLRSEGAGWTLEPVPSVPELYPNMCNKRDGQHAATKLELAKRLRDITLLWYCGPKERRRAHAAGVTGFSDRRLTTELLGLNPKGSRTPTIAAMISFHRAHALGRPMPLVTPSVLRYHRYQWRESGRLEMFVDFETVNNVFDRFDDFPKTTTTSMIFMIGLGWVVDGVWNYHSWHVTELTDDALRVMIRDFMEFANGLCDTHHTPHPNMYHWSSAEPNWLTSAVDRVFQEAPMFQPILCDAMKVLIDDSVCIVGVYGYSLKQVSKGLASIGRIPDLYTPLAGRCGDGMDAMVLAVDSYKFGDPTANPRFADIVEYNQVDCRSMWEILRYLREEH